MAKVNFPAAAKLSDDVFRDCHSLKEFHLTGDGSLSLIEDRKALVRNNTELVAYPSASGSVKLDNITSIAGGAFCGCKNLVSVNFPWTTSVGDRAFLNCTSLVNVDLSSVINVGEHAFAFCTSLASLNLPLVTHIGKCAFLGCNGQIFKDWPMKYMLTMQGILDPDGEEEKSEEIINLSTRKGKRAMHISILKMLKEIGEL